MIDEIIEIIELDEELTMDIEVDGNHLFFADDILVHNSAHEAEKLHQTHIQGGMSKVNTADYLVGIKQDDMMRAAGEIYLTILKSRNSDGKGKTIHLGWNPKSLCIEPLKKTQTLKQSSQKKVLPTGNTVFSKKKSGDDPLSDLIRA